MDDFLEQVAGRRRQGLFTAAYYAMWVLIVMFGLMAVMAISSIIGMNEDGSANFNFINLIIGAALGAFTYLLWRKADYCRMEYDYTFTNGTLDVSQVLNNKRRRYLLALDTKDIVQCGPAKGKAFMKLVNDSSLKKHNWFLNRDANLYYFYFVKKNIKHLAVLELHEDMVELIRSKSYLQRGVWTDEDGKSSYGVLPR